MTRVWLVMVFAIAACTSSPAVEPSTTATDPTDSTAHKVEVGFCDSTIPLVDGRTPTVWDMEDIIEASDSIPDVSERAAVTGEAEALLNDLQPWWGPGDYSTGPLIDIVSEVCDVQGLESIRAYVN